MMNDQLRIHTPRKPICEFSISVDLKNIIEYCANPHLSGKPDTDTLYSIAFYL